MKYQAKAIGSGSEGAQTELQKEYHRVSLFNVNTIKVLITSYNSL
jgi:20S proteasome subunit alpha 5